MAATGSDIFRLDSEEKWGEIYQGGLSGENAGDRGLISLDTVDDLLLPELELGLTNSPPSVAGICFKYSTTTM
jgi:hypothetical protein